MTTLDVARLAGLDVRQKGSRSWALCPFHSERTPSFCIFPDGHWHCFGCGNHGDAVSLYAALNNTTTRKALRIVKGKKHISGQRTPTLNDLRTIVDTWFSDRWQTACSEKHAAQAILDTVNDLNSDTFWQALQRKAHAEDELNALESATKKQLVNWILAEGEKNS